MFSFGKRDTFPHPCCSGVAIQQSCIPDDVIIDADVPPWQGGGPKRHQERLMRWHFLVLSPERGNALIPTIFTKRVYKSSGCLRFFTAIVSNLQVTPASGKCLNYQYGPFLLHSSIKKPSLCGAKMPACSRVRKGRPTNREEDARALTLTKIHFPRDPTVLFFCACILFVMKRAHTEALGRR